MQMQSVLEEAKWNGFPCTVRGCTGSGIVSHGRAEYIARLGDSQIN